VEGERCVFFWAWLVTCPVFSTGFSALIHISLTDIALELTCRSQVNVFPSTPACFREAAYSQSMWFAINISHAQYRPPHHKVWKIEILFCGLNAY
jgi:hypothetical protein